MIISTVSRLRTGYGKEMPRDITKMEHRIIEDPPLNVVLHRPEIPANTGNIARLCAAAEVRMHLIHPLGFKVDDKHLKRAGLDYWYEVDVRHHDSFEKFLAQREEGEGVAGDEVEDEEDGDGRGGGDEEEQPLARQRSQSLVAGGPPGQEEALGWRGDSLAHLIRARSEEGTPRRAAMPRRSRGALLVAR